MLIFALTIQIGLIYYYKSEVYMTIKEAIYERHTVRKFTDEKLSDETVKLLNARIDELNEKYGLCIELVTNNAEGVAGIARALISKGVNNYFVLAAKDEPNMEEKLGYCGSDLCLYAQTLGLNTWWIGGMFSLKGVKKNTKSADAKVNSIIVVGYGQTQGTQHKSKAAEEVSSFDGVAPDWYKNGIEAALLAPTAVNRQAFTIKAHDDKVSITYKPGPFSSVDLGIVRHHFEIGAGEET